MDNIKNKFKDITNEKDRKGTVYLVDNYRCHSSSNVYSSF